MLEMPILLLVRSRQFIFNSIFSDAQVVFAQSNVWEAYRIFFVLVHAFIVLEVANVSFD